MQSAQIDSALRWRLARAMCAPNMRDRVTSLDDVARIYATELWRIVTAQSSISEALFVETGMSIILAALETALDRACAKFDGNARKLAALCDWLESDIGIAYTELQVEQVADAQATGARVFEAVRAATTDAGAGQ